MSHWHFPTTTSRDWPVDIHIALGVCACCGKSFTLNNLVKPVTGRYANQCVCLSCISKLNTVGPSETKESFT